MNYDNGMCIFLSYSWSDKNVADKIEQYFSEKGIKVKRDTRDIGNWSSIKKFMSSIRSQDYAILIISKKYLTSVNCMFEVMEIAKEEEYQNKIFPVVLEHSIYTAEGKIEYIKFWENSCNELKQSIKTINIENSAEMVIELKRRKQITFNISEFLSLVADMNNPQMENVIDAIEDRLIKSGIKINNNMPNPSLAMDTTFNKSSESIMQKVLKSSFEEWDYYDEHGEFIFKQDVNLKIVRDGFEEKIPFSEPWAVNHPDKNAYMYRYTIFYNNSRIDEFYLVAVDGFRSYIPLPELKSSIIPRKQYLLAKAVNYDGRLDEYIERSNLTVAPK